MLISTRQSLQQTHFTVESSWCEEHPLQGAGERVSPGVFARLSPAGPELESQFSAVGLLAQFNGETPRAYTLGKREPSGHLVLFFAYNQTPLPVGLGVRLVEA